VTKEEYLALCEAHYEAGRYAKTAQMNLVELEEMFEASGRLLARKLLESRLEEDPRAHPDEPCACPRCKRKLRIQEGAQSRTLRTLLGEIVYRRAYGVCDGCGYTGAPLDEAVGISRTGPSVGLRQKICHAAVATRSFEMGRDVLRVHGGVDISRKHVRTMAEGEGRRLVKERAAEVKLFEQGRLDIPSGEAPPLIVVTCDGGRVQTRHKQDRWREDKIGVVYDAIAKPHPSASHKEYKGAKARTKSHVATMESWESFGWMLRWEAERRGYEKAKERLFVADGAQTVRELRHLHFPDATFILDWPHAAGHLSDCAKAAFGEGTEKAQRWYEKHKDMLWDGKRDEIIADLQEQSQHLGPPLKRDPSTSPRVVLHRNAHSYFPNNREAMDYPAFRAKGWPLASGVVEGAVNQFGLRMKGSCKFWNLSDTGAEEMLALCALYFSEDGRWDRYWRRRAQPYPQP
jgi:hypothetical protein